MQASTLNPPRIKPANTRTILSFGLDTCNSLDPTTMYTAQNHTQRCDSHTHENRPKVRASTRLVTCMRVNSPYCHMSRLQSPTSSARLCAAPRLKNGVFSSGWHFWHLSMFFTLPIGKTSTILGKNSRDKILVYSSLGKTFAKVIHVSGLTIGSIGRLALCMMTHAQCPCTCHLC